MSIFPKRFAHWTPRYLWDRANEIAYQRSHPELPWLTRAGNDFLSGYLKRQDKGLEFGSGRSTVWLARRVSSLVSLEHDEGWFEQVKLRLLAPNLAPVDYRRLHVDGLGSADAAQRISALLADLPPANFDFIVVDGVWRDHCTQHAVRLLKPGGVLIIDNANRHLPNSSRSPESRNHAQGPDGPLWAELANILSSWRSYWTSSGVTDTAFFFKPID
jgi:predicted O-methyltransferase YrrM